MDQEILQWDVTSWKKALDYWEKKVDWLTVVSCMELGGRQGGLSLWLALKGKQTICSDLRETEKTAEPLHKLHNVESYINYQDIDATNIPYENHFDIIVFKSIIGGIGYGNNKEHQAKAIKQMFKALKPGGKLLFAENTVASPLHKFFRKKFVNWGSSWRYISITEMSEFLSDFKPAEIQTTGFLATFGRSESQRKLLAKLDNLIFNRISPKSWKYICYGIAEKPEV